MKKQGAVSAWTRKSDAIEAAAHLAEQFLDLEPQAIFFFCSHRHDGAALSRALKGRYPEAEVIGCSTAGEFTQANSGVDSVSALALSKEKVRRCASALARCDGGTEQGVKVALDALSSQLNVKLRELDGQRWVGVVLVEGLKMKEEEVNEQLGNHAPLISFVGGSAGDNLEFKETRVFCNGESSADGAALLLMELSVPFLVAKTCSFESTGTVWRVSRVDEKTRTVYEVEGKPIAEVYAKAVGTSPGKLDGQVFMSHPVGLMIDGKPWIRSPQQLLPDGGLRFYCKVSEGMPIHLMRSTDLLADTERLLAGASAELGAPVQAALAFNCILRRLELDASNQHERFKSAFRGLQTSGFHTYGESWLGHINQTLTALFFA